MTNQPEKTARPNAPFAYDGLERVIHEKARLGILSSLVAHAAGLGFSELKQLCALTDGNLNRHLQVLQEAGMVEVRKESRLNRPHTLCQLTAEGRRRFVEYISVLEQIVADSLSAGLGEIVAARPIATGPLGTGPLGTGLSPA